MRPFFLIMGFWMACVSLAEAHAFLDHALPAVGSKVHGAPVQVKLWFTDDLGEPGWSVQILDAAGRAVDRQSAKIDEKDPSVMIVSLPPLKSGKYQVNWKAVCPEKHKTSGTFTFEVEE